MAILIGHGYINITPRLAGNFASQLRSTGQGLGHTLTQGITLGIGSQLFSSIASQAKTLGTSLIGTASNMEQARISFTNMLGSGEKANVFLKQLADFAAKTPFEFPDLVRASQKLMAMGVSAKDVIPTMTAVGDAVAAMGGTSADIDKVTLALGQMVAKGRVQGDELLQLQEAGIPALKILADSYGLTTVEMQKQISAGQVLTSDAMPKLIAGIEHGTKSVKGFAGMMEAQSHTMAGLWSTLKDTVSLNLVPAFDPLIKIAEAVMPAAIQKLSVVLGAFGRSSQGFFDALTAGWNAVGSGAAWSLSRISGVEKVGAGFHVAQLGAAAFFAAMKTGDVTSDGFVGSMERLGASLHNAQPALAELGRMIGDLVMQRLRQLGDIIRQIAPMLLDFARVIGASIIPVLAGLSNALSQALSYLLAAFGTVLRRDIIPGLTSLAGVVLRDVLPALGSLAATVGKNLGQELTTLGSLFRTAVVPALREVGYWIRDVVAPALRTLSTFIADYVVPALAKGLRPAIEGLTTGLRWIRDAIDSNRESWRSFSDAIKPIVTIIRDQLVPIFGGILKAAFIAIGAVISGLIYVVGGLVRGLSALGLLKPMLVAVFAAFMPLVAVVVIIKGVIAVVSQLVDWLKNLGVIATPALNALRTAWDAVWRAMSTVLGPVWAGIRAAVQAGISAVTAAVSAGMTAVRTVWNAAWTVMSTIVSAVWTVIRPIVQAGMTVVQTVISAGMTVVRTLWNAAWSAISTAVSAAWVVIRPIVQAGMAVIQTVISAGMTVVRTLWSAAWTVMSTLLTAAWNVIRPIVQAGMTVIQAVISAGMTVIRTVWNAAWTVISALMTTVWNTIKAVVSAGVLVVRTVIEAAWKVVQTIFYTVWGLIAAAFKATWLVLQTTVGAATSWIRDTINTVWTFVKNNVFAPIWNAISTAFNNTWNALKLIVSLATAWIRDTINTVWNFVKNNIFAPIWNAISAAFNVTWNLLKTIVGAATSWISTTINTVWNFVKNNVFAPIWNAISTAFHNTWETIKTTANAAITWVHDRIKTVLGTISGVWSGAWNGMRDVLGGIWNGIKTAIRTPVNAIISGLNFFFDPINAVIDWAIGKRPLPHLDPVSMATGGRLPGYGGGDSVPAMLEPGEAVIPKHLVPDIAAWARDKRIPGFQTGGLVGASGNALIAFMEKSGIPFTVTSTARPDSPFHALGEAVDFTGPNLPAIAAYWATYGANLLELIYSGTGQTGGNTTADFARDPQGFLRPTGIPGAGAQYITNGQPATYDPITVADHYDHVHVAATLDAINRLLAMPSLPTAPPNIGQPPTSIGQGSGNLTGVVETPDKGIGILGTIIGGIASGAAGAADILGSAAKTVGGLVGDAAKWVYAEGIGLLRIGASGAVSAILAPIRAGVKATVGKLGQPGAMAAGIFDKTTQAIIDWIKGKEGPPPDTGGGGQGVADPVGVVNFARQQLGKAYGPPYYGPNSFSCDGLVWYVFNHFGIETGRNAEIEMRNAQRISEGESKPGDVVGFRHPSGGPGMAPGYTFGHIGIVSGPNKTINALGHAYGVVESSITGITGPMGRAYGRFLKNLNPGYSAGAAGLASGGGGFTRAQMEQAMLQVGAPAGIAHIFAAIGMAENPRSTRVTNPTGTYDSVWALQEAWTIPKGLDINRLNTDIVYAAGVAYDLYKTSGFRPWEAYTNGSYAKFLSEGGLVKSYDTGGWLPPGLSLAYNGTGQPERVGGAVQNTVNLTINVANGDPVTIRTVAQQVVDDALTQLARKLSSGSGRN